MPTSESSVISLEAGKGKQSRREFLTASMSAAGAAASMPWLAVAAVESRPLAGKAPELCRATVVQLAELIRRREVSSLEVVNALLTRIEQVNPRLNAIVHLDAEGARASARAADQAIARGGVTGPLHGVPMTIKDSLDTAGTITSGGTMGRKAFVPDTDATVVARLRSAGAILLGKTNTPELTWSFETRSPVYGRTVNPWNPAMSPGGSSGGAAAIIAACASPFDIGSDTGGSIREPAHFCGIAGIKPTSGRVPRTGHIVGAEGFTQSLTQLGPMARSIDDLALVLRVIAGPDWKDASVVPAPLGNHEDVVLRGLRVAMHVDNGLHPPSREFARVVQASAESLQRLGIEIEEAKPEALKDVMALDEDLFRADGGSWLRSLLERAGTKEPGPDVALSLKMIADLNKREMTAPEFAALLERWDAWRGRMLKFLERYDAILCPPCALDALPHGASDLPETYPAFSYTFAYNMTGWPAAVVRAGTSAQGLPLGVQVIGRPWREDVVLALARAIERSHGGFQPAPV
jgi:amidase